jgi:hypothetical protein
MLVWLHLSLIYQVEILIQRLSKISSLDNKINSIGSKLKKWPSISKNLKKCYKLEVV